MIALLIVHTPGNRSEANYSHPGRKQDLSNQYKIVFNTDTPVDVIFMYKNASSILALYEKDCLQGISSSTVHGGETPNIYHIEEINELPELKQYNYAVVYVDFNNYDLEELIKIITMANKYYDKYVVVLVDLTNSISDVKIDEYRELTRFIYKELEHMPDKYLDENVDATINEIYQIYSTEYNEGSNITCGLEMRIEKYTMIQR